MSHRVMRQIQTSEDTTKLFATAKAPFLFPAGCLWTSWLLPSFTNSLCCEFKIIYGICSSKCAVIDSHCAFDFTDVTECISLIWTLYVFLVCVWMHVWVHVCVHPSMHVFEANRQPRLSFPSYLPYMWERGPRALQVGLTGSPVSPRDPSVSISPGLGFRPHTTSPGLHILWSYSTVCPFLLHCFCIIEFWGFLMSSG